MSDNEPVENQEVAPENEVALIVVGKEPVMIRCSRCHEMAKGFIMRQIVKDDPNTLIMGSTGFVWMSESTQHLFEQDEVVLCTPCRQGRVKPTIVFPGEM